MEHTIPAGRTLRIANARGATVRVLDGTAWVTEAGERSDYTMGDGDTRVVGSDGLALVHAFDPVRVEIVGAQALRGASIRLGGGYKDYAATVWWRELAAAARGFARIMGWSLPSRAPSGTPTIRTATR